MKRKITISTKATIPTFFTTTAHAEKKTQLTRNRLITLPCFKFVADQHPIELVVFPVTGLRQAPINPVNHKPMLRANLQAVKDLLK